MAIKTNTAEAASATDGAAATGTLTGTAGDAFSAGGETGTRFFSNRAFHGSWAYKFVCNTSNATQFVWTATTNQVSFRFYFQFETIPTAQSNFLAVYASSIVSRVDINTSGKIMVLNAAATTLATLTPTVAAGTYYRLEIGTAVGTTTSNGTIRVSLFLGDQTTPLDSFISTTTNTGTAALQNVQFGKPLSSAATTYNAYFDDLRLDDSTATVLGAGGYTPTTTAVPQALYSNAGAWVPTGGTVTAVVGDASDATYIDTPGSTSNEAITYTVPPLAAGVVSITYKAAWTGAETPVKVDLLQGSTVIATRQQTLTSTLASYTMTLNFSENSAITDRADLRLSLTGNPT